jgi:putative MATE family efflux protein
VDDHLSEELGARSAERQIPKNHSPAPDSRSSALRVPSSELLEGPIWRPVLLLAWPVLIQQLLTVAVTFSDRLLAGRFQSVDAADLLASQAALTTAQYLDFFISSYTVLVTVGATALVARCVGAGDRPAAVRFTNQALLLAVILGGLASVVGLLGLPLLLRLLGLHGAAADLACSYLRPLFLLLVFRVVEAAGIACLVGAGDTRTGLGVLGLVAVINVPLAWLCFFGFGPVPPLAFTGIAVGTAVSHVVGGLVVLGVLLRGRFGLYFRPALLRPHLDDLRRLLRVSVPAGLDSLSVACGQLWFLSIVNRLGDTASGAHGIALYWEALGYCSGAAFGTAAMTLVGQNLGAGRPERAARSGWVTFALGAGVMSFMGLVFFVLARPMFRLFCPGAEQTPIVAAGVPVLRLVAFAMPALASCIIFTAALRGAGDTRVPVLFTWLGFFVVRIPLAYLLTGPVVALGLLGAWLAMCADLVVRGVFFAWRFATGRWQHLRV